MALNTILEVKTKISEKQYYSDESPITNRGTSNTSTSFKPK